MPTIELCWGASLSTSLSLHIPSWIGELAQLWETSSSSPWWGHFITKRDWMDDRRVKWTHKWFSGMFLKHGVCWVMLTPILATYPSVVRGQVGVFKLGMLVWYSWSITLDYLSGTRHNVSIKMRRSVLRTRAQSGVSTGEYYCRVLAFTRPPLQCHVKNLERVRFFKNSVFGLSISLLN